MSFLRCRLPLSEKWCVATIRKMWLNVLAKLGIIFDKKEGLLMFMLYSFV